MAKRGRKKGVPAGPKKRTGKNRLSQISDARIEEVLIEVRGNIAAASRVLDVAYQALWHRIERSSGRLKEARAIAANSFLDVAHARLYEAVNQGNMKAIAILYKYYGKFAGLGESHEVVVVDGEKLLQENLDPRILESLKSKGETTETILSNLLQSVNTVYEDAEQLNESEDSADSTD